MHEATSTVAVGERVAWSDGQGTTSIERRALRLARFRTEGFLSDELEYYARARNAAILDELVARGEPPALRGFYDWSEMTGYSTGARNESTTFIMARRKQFALVFILFRSPAIALAINVANIIVGGFVKATTSRDEFEARWQEALRAEGLSPEVSAGPPPG